VLVSSSSTSSSSSIVLPCQKNNNNFVYLRPHKPGGRNVAVPTFVLVFSLAFSPPDLYYRRQKCGKKIKKNNINRKRFLVWSRGRE